MNRQSASRLQGKLTTAAIPTSVRTKLHKRRASANQQFAVVARPEDSRLGTDKMPDVRGLLRLG
jgi:hypothetical protein